MGNNIEADVIEGCFDMDTIEAFKEHQATGVWNLANQNPGRNAVQTRHSA